MLVLPEVVKWLRAHDWTGGDKPAIWLSLHSFAWGGVDTTTFVSALKELQEMYGFTYDPSLKPQSVPIPLEASKLYSMFLFTDSQLQRSQAQALR